MFARILSVVFDLNYEPEPRLTRLPVYWATWSLAYYQWFSGFCFAEIHQVLPFDERETNIRRLRIYNGFSQKDLSFRSGVTLLDRDYHHNINCYIISSSS